MKTPEPSNLRRKQAAELGPFLFVPLQDWLLYSGMARNNDHAHKFGDVTMAHLRQT